MKFFHISDLHLGIRLYDFDLIEDQKYILDRIVALASEHEPDAVLICGDVYDRNIPSEAAIRLFDSFIWDLKQLDLKVFIIGGNHDSSDRLSFGSRLMESEDVYISPAYSGHVAPVEVKDDLGSVSIYSLPFIKPASVRRFFPDEDIKDYTDAVGAAIAEMNPDKGKRNVLLCHQFVTGAKRSDSEDLVVGGLDNTDSSVFSGFDYVALGHIHCPQDISSGSSALIRYCGTPLKYSISESSQTKSVTCVELLEKGSVTVSTIPLTPLRDLREIRGKYADLMLRSSYENTNTNDYLHVTLTDEDDVYEGLSRLRTVYPNIIKLDYDNTRTRADQHVSVSEIKEVASPLDLYNALFYKQNNRYLSEAEESFMIDLIDRVRGDGE